MAQLQTPAQFNEGPLPSVPQDLYALIAQQTEQMESGFFTGSFNVLRARRNLELTIDGVMEEFPYGKLGGVLLTSNLNNHALWYAHEYNAASNDAPDLQWVRKDENTFPDALPQQFRKKIPMGGKTLRWGFQIKRRTVWLPVMGQGINFDTPFVLDIPSSLLYGKSEKQGCYTWKDIINLCKQESRRGVPIFPGMFITIFVAHTSPQMGMFLFQPLCDQQGYLHYLDPDTIRRVVTMAQDPDIKAMCEVKEKLTYGDTVPAPQAPAQPAQPTRPAPQPAQPARPASQPAQPAPQVQAQPAQPAPQAQTQPAQSAQVTPQPTPAQPAQAQPQATGTAGLMQNAGLVLDQLAQQQNQTQPTQPAQVQAQAQAQAQAVGAVVNEQLATFFNGGL